MTERDISDLQHKMEAIWRECQKGPQPDFILCRPFQAYAGNWRRLLCWVIGHDWRDDKFLNITHQCSLCEATQVVEWDYTDVPELDAESFDWWKS